MTAGDGVALACWPLSRFVVGAYKIPVAVAPWAASLPLSRPCVLAPRQITGLRRDWPSIPQAASLKPARELEHRAQGGDLKAILKKTHELPG